MFFFAVVIGVINDNNNLTESLFSILFHLLIINEYNLATRVVAKKMYQ